ncbi:MAG TPA: hypothetical protein VHC43_09930 [Mycobacteriales bacterium]|nr:hypothetical protein [Mycobacteriales bacterium]
MTNGTNPLRLVDVTDSAAVAEMQYPRYTIDGKAFDCGLDRAKPDPFIGPCPAWCEGHPTTETSQDDRTHYGSQYDVLVRSLPFDYMPSRGGGDPDIVLAQVIRSYLRQDVLHRDPVIHVAVSEKRGIEFTPAEARELGKVLAALADEAERG